eukprot:31108-Pelagococcus_subviridis.AAC.5
MDLAPRTDGGGSRPSSRSRCVARARVVRVVSIALALPSTRRRARRRRWRPRRVVSSAGSSAIERVVAVADAPSHLPPKKNGREDASRLFPSSSLLRREIARPRARPTTSDAFLIPPPPSFHPRPRRRRRRHAVR